MKVHLVLYANGLPFTDTKQLLIDTIKQHCNREVIIHDYNLDQIKQLPWFTKIQDLPEIEVYPYARWRRDGFYNCWKSFIVHDVYNQMEDDDLLYYVDSSKYFCSGFDQNIDNLCDWAKHYGMIAGSVASDITNTTIRCCHKIRFWNIIIPGDNRLSLTKMHVLNSWFIIAKNPTSSQFISDWCDWSVYIPNGCKVPIVTQHHTVDQSVFNILVHKYNLRVFFHPNIKHQQNKDRNTVLKIINNEPDPSKYFINL